MYPDKGPEKSSPDVPFWVPIVFGLAVIALSTAAIWFIAWLFTK